MIVMLNWRRKLSTVKAMLYVKSLHCQRIGRSGSRDWRSRFRLFKDAHAAELLVAVVEQAVGFFGCAIRADI